ncbi:hypothetical protein CPB86DRAFT_813153 [Serendipita vermifera]|nr:hypothetical protein CPB86DRAFT_813153 [Serendipita vermifera]
MFKLAVAVVAAALLTAQPILAQEVSECVQNCLAEGLTSSSCGSLDNVECLCSDETYTGTVATCVTTNCPDDLESAIAYQTATCSGDDTETGTETTTATEETGEEPTDTDDETEATSTGTTTRNTATSTRATSSTPRSTSSTSATSSTSSTGAGFHSASIASGVTVALFGAALSLF